MLDISKILTVQDKLNGFSIEKNNDAILLNYNGLSIAVFNNIEDEESLQGEIRDYMDLNTLLMDSSKELNDKFYAEAEGFVKDEFCSLCKKDCKGICRKAKSSINALYFGQWGSYTQLN
jgi:hypothetical protein